MLEYALGKEWSFKSCSFVLERLCHGCFLWKFEKFLEQIFFRTSLDDFFSLYLDNVLQQYAIDQKLYMGFVSAKAKTCSTSSLFSSQFPLVAFFTCLVTVTFFGYHACYMENLISDMTITFIEVLLRKWKLIWWILTAAWVVSTTQVVSFITTSGTTEHAVFCRLM